MFEGIIKKKEIGLLLIVFAIHLGYGIIEAYANDNDKLITIKLTYLYVFCILALVIAMIILFSK